MSPEIIEGFLNGNNPLKYVVGIEGGYSEPTVDLIINDPVKGKYILKQKYKPFIWFKDEVKKLLYNGNRDAQKYAADKKDIRTKKLGTSDPNGFIPERIQNGFKYIATTSGSYNDLVMFFRGAGVDIFDAKYKKLFFMLTPVEQFMIQSNVRLFKGIDDYNDLHRMQFDLETTGLSGHKDSIFEIGIKDNRGFETVLEATGSTPQEKRTSERRIIQEFFDIIFEKKPDIVAGYNSESFDWTFIEDRCERLGINLERIAIGYDGKTSLRRKPSILKLGNEIESINQTYLWGTNIIDIAHSVRRAQAINSNIKKWTLKYITQYSEIAKKNRVYVKGDNIHTIWSDEKSKFAFNNTNGDWYKISDRMPIKDHYEIVNGSYIIQRYLLDDLWETEQIDIIFNQAAFLIAKILPTTYSRSITMGTATQWKLIMAAWSYENNLAIPETEPKRAFTGGLSRLLQVGYAKNVVKLDYAALYPKTQLTHDIFPDLDISGVMKGLLTYVVDTRDTSKFLMEEHKSIVKKLKKQLEEKGLSNDKIEELENNLKKNKALVNLYDKKQMPLKILANSWFGAYGAPYIFNWGDTNCAEETTCRGRQYFRLMVKYFTEKYGFKPLVGDTDGFNFQFPENIKEVKYTALGTHWKTTQDADKELTGLNAVLAEFNENYMIGRMGLDIDEICNSTINFSRKNYATDVDGKIKFVGNSIKSKKMPVYIEDFLDKAIRLLLDGKGREFINYYYEYVDKIYNYNIPLVKIASKSKIKISIHEYKLKATKKNKAGKPMPKQAHMELVLKHGLNVNLGDTIFYVNIGTGKLQGDIKTVKNADGVNELQINSKLIDAAKVESDLEILKEIETMNKILLETTDTEEIKDIQNKILEMEGSLITDEYNVAKYLEALNKKVKPMLVCFHPDIRNRILLSIKKDKKTKIEKLEERVMFMEEQCELVSGLPSSPEDQDSYEQDVMMMEDKEIKFWHSVNKLPNNMLQDEWNSVLNDYHLRMEKQREEGIIFETGKFNSIIKELEIGELNNIIETKVLPESIIMFAYVNANGFFVSKRWEVVLGHIDDIFKYENDAFERNKWYQISNTTAKNKYELWLKYKLEHDIVIEEISDKTIPVVEIKVIEKDQKIEEPEILEDDDEDEEEDDFEERSDAELMLEIQKEINSLTGVESLKIVSTPEKAPILAEQKLDVDEWNF